MSDLIQIPKFRDWLVREFEQEHLVAASDGKVDEVLSDVAWLYGIEDIYETYTSAIWEIATRDHFFSGMKAETETEAEFKHEIVVFAIEAEAYDITGGEDNAE